MLTIEKTVLPSPAQWEIIIEGMRNPMNSWDKSDSYITYIENLETKETADLVHVLGEKDLDLMRRLAAGGSVHAKYRRMIPVYVTINAPRYWWTEFSTYKIGTVENSCSTMHKIHAKPFALDDFSYDQLSSGGYIIHGEDCFLCPKDMLKDTILSLNMFREKYLETKDKRWWWQMIQTLPQSYNQKRTVMLNYEVLVNIYRWRRDHKLDEWHTFCDWVEALPYSELITGERTDRT